MITSKLLRDWGACWTDERIAEKLGNRSEVTPRDVAFDTSISFDDRLWVLCRCLWHLDESEARAFAIESAAAVAHLAGDDDDQAQYLGLLNRLMEIEDLPPEDRYATWGAARGAARDAARDAARAATWDAARDATWVAARDAAWDAARAATRGAARGAARDAARAATWDAARDATWEATWAAARAAARAATWGAARDATWEATWAAARDAALQSAIDRALMWLGDYADGWED